GWRLWCVLAGLDAAACAQTAESGGTEGQLAAMSNGFGFDDGETESAACRGGTRATLEAAHHAFAFGRRDAGAVVVDHDFGSAVELCALDRDVPAGASVPGSGFERVVHHAAGPCPHPDDAQP